MNKIKKANKKAIQSEVYVYICSIYTCYLYIYIFFVHHTSTHDRHCIKGFPYYSVNGITRSCSGRHCNSQLSYKTQQGGATQPCKDLTEGLPSTAQQHKPMQHQSRASHRLVLPQPGFLSRSNQLRYRSRLTHITYF